MQIQVYSPHAPTHVGFFYQNSLLYYYNFPLILIVIDLSQLRHAYSSRALLESQSIHQHIGNSP